MNDNNGSTKCDEAEAFAMELLMPAKMMYDWCIKLAKADVPTYEYPAWIAKLFGVPSEKARLRLEELCIL